MGEAAKIYLGNLPPHTDHVDVRNRFKQYGVIHDVKLMKNFGFVQFSSPQMAASAIGAENGKNFLGNVIQVKTTTKQQQQGASEPSKMPGLMGAAPGVSTAQPGQGYSDGFPPQGFPGVGYGYPQGGFRPQQQPDPYQQQGPYGAQVYPPREYGGGGPQAAAPAPAAPSAPRPPPPQGRDPKACDCEIVCVDRSNHLYCESIETRLKAIGMTVDILYPTPGVQLRKILENIIGRGVTYAVLVTSENQQTGTVTVNKLQGQQSEKLNISVDAAVKLLSNDFGSNIRAGGDGGGSDVGSALSGPGFAGPIDRRGFPGRGGGGGDGVHPPEIMTVIDFLVDNRPLSVMEYDKLIRYLAQQREDMLRREYGDDIPSHLMSPPVGHGANPELKAKEEEFKAKILGILSRPLVEPKPTPSASTASITPSLQSAIDSLFKSGSGQGQSVQQSGSYYDGGYQQQQQQQKGQSLFSGY